MKEEFLKRIDEIKEVLSNMPQNNKKNKDKYLEYVREQLSIFYDLKDRTVDEIERRVKAIKGKVKSKGIDFSKDDEKIIELYQKLVVFDRWNTPYEKIDLDRIIFEINHYYKDNLDALNEDIRDAVECFKRVGVNLSVRDFIYSSYVNQYMSVILNQEEDVKAISKRLDDVYWKSPKVMNQIACNFQYLYFQYEKKFLNYFAKLEKDICLEESYDVLHNKYDELLLEKFKAENSIENIVSLVMNGDINIKDYSEDKLHSYEESISNGHIDSLHYIEFYYSLEEYKVYKEYAFIIDKVKELYQNKAQYKNVYKNLRKEINKLEGKLFKVNKKISFQKKYFHKKEKEDLLELEVNNLTDSLIEKEKELHFSKVNEIISSLNDSTSYFDILKLVSSYYIYFRELMVENQEGISEEEVLSKRVELGKFLCSNHLHFLPNISIMEEANIAQIIADKEKLLNINVSADEIDSNVDGYMELIRKIMISNAIVNSSVSYEELLFQFSSKDIV